MVRLTCYFRPFSKLLYCCTGYIGDVFRWHLPRWKSQICPTKSLFWVNWGFAWLLLCYSWTGWTWEEEDLTIVSYHDEHHRWYLMLWCGCEIPVRCWKRCLCLGGPVPNLYSATHLQVPFLLFLNLLCHSLPPHGPTTMLLCSTWSNSSICCHQQFHTLLQLALSSCLPLGVWLRGFQALSLSRPPSQALFPPEPGLL